MDNRQSEVVRRAQPVWLVTFATYRRKHVFGNLDLRERCAEALLETTHRNGYRVYALAVMPDHVHLVLDAGGSDHAVPKVLNNLKGVTARRVFQTSPDLRIDLASNHLWADEYQAQPLPTVNAVQWACAYVRRNPVEIGWPEQGYDWLAPLG